MSIFDEQLKNQLAERRILTKGTAIKPTDTLDRLRQDFLNEKVGEHKSERSVETYDSHWLKVFEFLGWLAKGYNPAKDDFEETQTECRTIGAALQISSLDNEQLPYFYHEYLCNVRTRRGAPISEQTVISSMRNFRVFMYYAMRLKLISNFDIKVTNVEPPIKPTFTTDEIWRLTHRRPDKGNFVEYRNWVMINYLLATGNRIGSVLELNVEDIDFENNEISIQRTKGKRPQILALTSKLKNILYQYIGLYRTREDGTLMFHEPLFPNQFGERLTYEGARDSFKDYYKANYVDWEGFHKFRHSYAAAWMRQGGDSLKLKAQLGHSSLAMTNRYANLYGKAVAADAEEYALINKTRTTAGRKKIKAIDK